MDFTELLDRYARLITEHGLNVQPGQLVSLAGEVSHRELLFLVAEHSYRLGAKYVQVDLLEPRLQKARIVHSSLEQLGYVPPFLSEKYGELVRTTGANLKITGAEYPEILSDLDPVKINTGRKAQYQALKAFYDDGIGRSQVHWTVAAGATRRWAQRVFPALEAAEAERSLWNAIFKICRVDQPNCIELWQEHDRNLKVRAKRLTDLRIAELHFVGPGTDLVVGLSPKAVFKGGGDESPRNVEFEPNLPTEECFTTPDCNITRGKVAATRPFFVNGKLIRNLTLEFEAGRIVRFDATEGKEMFSEYIKSDAGACRLGEVALVGIDSPVYQSGLVFEEILFDENAACHIAVGSAYKFCIENGTELPQAELQSLGCNESSVHTDIMISSDQVQVDAKTFDGGNIRLIANGAWCAGW